MATFLKSFTPGLPIIPFAGGNAPPYSTATEEYDGTGFSNGGNMNDNRDPYSGFGTLTDTVTAGGYDGSNKAESEMK